MGRTTASAPTRAAAPPEQARDRLLAAALRLFADQGFAKTSTRQIAQAAGANVAAIRYYFGDKAGLYRAAFTEPLCHKGGAPSGYDAARLAALDMEQALALVMRSFLEPMKQGELAHQCMRLHYREILEPTSAWQAELADDIRPAHEALVRRLARHFGLARADDEVHRLAFAIAALPIYLYVGRDVIELIRPRLLAGDAAVDAACQRLTRLALDMVEGEAARRARGTKNNKHNKSTANA